MMAGHENREVNSKIWHATKGNPAILFEQLANGDPMGTIADRLNVSQQAIRQYMLRVDEDAYHEARQIAADYQMIELEEIAASPDIDCARARNMINVGQFKLERRYASSGYGRIDKLEVSGTIEVASKLQAARKRLADKGYIDAEVVGDSEEG